MTFRNTPNSTGQIACELMFGRKVRKRLDLMKASQKEQSNGELPRNQRIPGSSKLVNASKYVASMTNLLNGNLDL